MGRLRALTDPLVLLRRLHDAPARTTQMARWSLAEIAARGAQRHYAGWTCYASKGVYVHLCVYGQFLTAAQTMLM